MQGFTVGVLSVYSVAERSGSEHRLYNVTTKMSEFVSWKEFDPILFYVFVKYEMVVLPPLNIMGWSSLSLMLNMVTLKISVSFEPKS